jgi:hypothetical protein
MEARKMKREEERWEAGRRPKHDDFDDLEPFENEEGEDDDDADDAEENEEVDFDNPKFKKTDMWNDYAEDLDFEE